MARPRIAVIDDDPALRAALAEWLTSAGYSPVVFGDGAEALAAVQADPPDLILLDYVMPVLGGASVLQSLQADPRLQSIPVLVLTGMPDDLPPLPGVAAVVGKPFHLSHLEEIIRVLVKRGPPR